MAKISLAAKCYLGMYKDKDKEKVDMFFALPFNILFYDF